MTSEQSIDTLLLKKARGAFYTPKEICDFIIEWAVRKPTDNILEPSCGEATFLMSAAGRLQSLGLATSDITHSISGVEVHTPSATAAEKLLWDAGVETRIRNIDFFELPPTPVHDAVVGNPPYVRYQQFGGNARAKGLEIALAQGIRLSLLSSSWAPFVIHAAQFLKPQGRLALVLPAELLSVNYATEVRRFLLNRFAKIKIVMFEQLVFPEVLEEVILLLAEGTGPTASFEVYQARDLSDLQQLTIERGTKFTPGEVNKWTSALVGAESLNVYHSLLKNERVSRLLDWGDSYLGVVTGNNKYFTLTAEDVKRLGIPKCELLPISPPGSRHLRALVFSDRCWLELDQLGKACYLLYPDYRAPSHEAVRYIEIGEQRGVQTAYKCRVRKPWWRVPLVPKPDLFLSYMDHICPRLVSNEAGVLHLNSLYGVKLKTDRRTLGRDLLPVSSLNSMTLLGAEMIGRSYGGGILKLEPKEADQLPFPSLELLEAAADDLRTLRPQLSIHLRQGRISDILKAVDRVLLKKHLGLTWAEIKSIRESREFLFARRTARRKRVRGADR